MEFNMFMNDIVDAARKDITEAGYEELKSPEEVDAALKREGTTLVMVNSTCGCAGGIARPAAANSIHFDKRPTHLATVFAGQDREATDRAREYFKGFEPSSPSFALLKDGEIVSMLERDDIETSSAVEVTNKLQQLFDAHCEEV